MNTRLDDLKKLSEPTPGNWSVKEYFDKDSKGYVIGKEYVIRNNIDVVATIKGTDLRNANDARLIANAPEILVSLVRMLRFTPSFPEETITEHGTVVKEAYTVVAKSLDWTLEDVENWILELKGER